MSARTLLGVWAHPDDEAYLSAGLMAESRRRGDRVVVVTATLGEQARAIRRRGHRHGSPRLRPASCDAASRRSVSTSSTSSGSRTATAIATTAPGSSPRTSPTSSPM